jgi:hypothetical protein
MRSIASRLAAQSQDAVLSAVEVLTQSPARFKSETLLAINRVDVVLVRTLGGVRTQATARGTLASTARPRPSRHAMPETNPSQRTSPAGGIADILFNGILVDRHVYVNVDGARARLPQPRTQEDLAVTQFEYDLISLVHNFEHPTEDETCSRPPATST